LKGSARSSFSSARETASSCKTLYQDQRNGDISQHYDPREVSLVPVLVPDANGVLQETFVPNRAALSFSNREILDPGRILLGLHHEWESWQSHAAAGWAGLPIASTWASITPASHF
jgi:hypothetical protein